MKILLCIVAVWFGIFCQSHAETETETETETDIDHLFSLSLEEVLKIQVTGSTLTDESIKTVPAAVSVFNHEQIQRMGINYLYELLNLVPGFQSQRTADFPLNFAYSARGRRNEFQSKEVLIIMDGRRLNDPRTDGVNPTLPLILLEQIERVEIIRGPGSAIYGSSAFTGVINIITRKGVSEVGFKLGSLEQVSAHQFYSYKNEGWQLDVFAQAYRDTGQDYRVDGSFSDGQIITSDPMETGQFDMAISHKSSVLRASIRQANTQGFYLLDRLSNDFNHYVISQKQISFDHLYSFSTVTSKLFLSYQQSQQDFHVQLTAPGGLADVSNPVSQQPWQMKGDFLGSSLQLKSHHDLAISDDINVQFGVELRRDREELGESDNNFNITMLLNNSTPIDSNVDFFHSMKIGTEATRQVVGSYVQYQQTLWGHTNALMGLRFDKYTHIDGHFSPRLSLVHQLNDYNTIKLLYGEAFRAPSLNETGLINNIILLGNPNLQHEVVKTWELIWQGLWQHSSLSMGWFQSQFSEPIEQALLNETVRTWVNGDASQSQGVELEVQQQLDYEWYLHASLTRLYQLPNAAFREASTLASLVLNYERSNWNASISAVYHSSREMLTPVKPLKLAEYWQLNSKLYYRVTKTSEYFFQVKNIMDNDILTAAQGSLISHGIPNRGREMSLGGLWRF